MVTVVGACGGVGASTLAALLAHRVARRGTRTVLVDLDGAAGGVEVLLGCEGAPGVRWADLVDVREPPTAADLQGLLPVWQGVDVLGHDRRPGPGGPTGSASAGDGVLGHGALAAVGPALLTGWDVVVLDVPPDRLDDPAVLSVRGGSRHVVVTTQDLRGVAAGLMARERVAPHRAHLVLRRARTATLAPAEVERALGLRACASLPSVRALPSAVERGLGPLPAARRGRVARRVEAVVAAVGG